MQINIKTKHITSYKEPKTIKPKSILKLLHIISHTHAHTHTHIIDSPCELSEPNNIYPFSYQI